MSDAKEVDNEEGFTRKQEDHIDKQGTVYNNQRIINSDSNHNQSRRNSRSSLRGDRKASSSSRSRSPAISRSNQYWKSRNPFINFMQDFRKNYIGSKSTRIFKLAGERWQKMSPREKKPYIDAANNAKQQKQQVNTNQHKNKPDADTTTKTPETTGKEQKKSDKDKSGQKHGRKSKSNTNTDSESAASGTTGSLTSEDASDSSS